MASSIKPTIGRKVWFYQGAGCGSGGYFNKQQPFDATVIYIRSDGVVDLSVVDHGGERRVFQNIELYDPQPDDRHGRVDRSYATWMPYQVGQAQPVLDTDKLGSALGAATTGYDGGVRTTEATLRVFDPTATATAPIRTEYREPGRIEQTARPVGDGPRVAEADLDANIAQEFYFRGDEAVRGANNCFPRVNEHQPHFLGDPPLALMTFCILVLRNGFTVVGKSACVSPENFDAAYDRKLAREDARRQLWPLLDFRLADEVAREKWAAANPAMPAAAV